MIHDGGNEGEKRLRESFTRKVVEVNVDYLKVEMMIIILSFESLKDFLRFNL